MTKKFTSAGTVEREPDPGNRDFRTVEPGNKKSGYLTSLRARKAVEGKFKWVKIPLMSVT